MKATMREEIHAWGGKAQADYMMGEITWWIAWTKINKPIIFKSKYGCKKKWQPITCEETGVMFRTTGSAWIIFRNPVHHIR